MLQIFCLIVMNQIILIDLFGTEIRNILFFEHFESHTPIPDFYFIDK
jgi:hypothetical protein